MPGRECGGYPDRVSRIEQHSQSGMSSECRTLQFVALCASERFSSSAALYLVPEAHPMPVDAVNKVDMRNARMNTLRLPNELIERCNEENHFIFTSGSKCV